MEGAEELVSCEVRGSVAVNCPPAELLLETEDKPGSVESDTDGGGPYP